jgi:hypothetical protein
VNYESAFALLRRDVGTPIAEAFSVAPLGGAMEDSSGVVETIADETAVKELRSCAALTGTASIGRLFVIAQPFLASTPSFSSQFKPIQAKKRKNDPEHLQNYESRAKG